jgi:NADH:ubiquinone oxidoreductase subunit 6 (subunit J)
MENLFQEVVFWMLAVITVGAALAVVHTQDMFRATLALVVSFLGVAGIFVLLNAEFIAVVQVLVYAGGVSVLVIFAVMVTRDVPEGNRNTRVQPLALVSAAGLLLALIYAVVEAQWTVLPDDLPGPVAAALVDSPAQLGQLLLNEFVLPFEIAGIVLLAAVVGALGLVRER